MDIIEKLEKEYTEELSQGKEIPEFRAGDNIAVNVLIKEGSRERIQTFEGVCISRSGEGLNKNFTVKELKEFFHFLVLLLNL